MNLSRPDVHALRVETTEGPHPARKLTRLKNAMFSEKMMLEVIPGGHGISALSTFQCKLYLSAEDAAYLNRHISAAASPPVEWFFVELTNRCNFRCQWCPQRKMTRPAGTMSYENAARIMKKIASYQNRNPFFSLYAQIRNPVFLHVMGEPLLHPRFFDIIAHGHQLGLDYCLVTNGSLLSGPIIQQIFDSGLKFLVLSLNAPDSESFLQTGSTHAYEDIVNNIQNLICERSKRRAPVPRIEIQLLNTKEPASGIFTGVSQTDQVRRTLVFWSDFVREQEYRWAMDPPHRQMEEEDGWQTALDEKGITPGVYFQLGRNLFLVFKQGVNFGNTLIDDGSEVIATHRGRCPFRNPDRTLCILWDGACTYCSLDFDNSVDLGNLLEMEIEDVWCGSRISRIRALMENDILLEPLCRQCQGKVVVKSMYPHLRESASRAAGGALHPFFSMR